MVVLTRSGAVAEADSPVRKSTLGVEDLGGGALFKSTRFCDFGFAAGAVEVVVVADEVLVG